MLTSSDSDYTVIDYIVEEHHNHYVGPWAKLTWIPQFTELCAPKLLNGHIKYVNKECDIEFMPQKLMFNLRTADYTAHNALDELDSGRYISKTYPAPLVLDVRVITYNLCFRTLTPVVDIKKDFYTYGLKLIGDFKTAVDYCRHNPLCTAITRRNYRDNVKYELAYGIPVNSPAECEKKTNTVWTNSELYKLWPADT
jgi:hypothetical protein